MPDYDIAGRDGTLLFELAPVSKVPYGVFYFLEMINDWDKGAFHRMGGHVLQAMASVKSAEGYKSLAYQEYSADFPHVKGTLGYAGRPGGPGFYISLIDNTHNHGPGSQQAGTTEADTCFGRIVGKESWVVIERMKNQPGAAPGAGWVSPASNYITIESVMVHS